MITDDQRRRLERKAEGRPEVVFRNKGRPGSRLIGRVEDQVSLIPEGSDYLHVLQRIRYADNVSSDGSQFAYRTGYYTFSYGGSRIVWGQYTQLLSEADFQALFAKARERGWNI